MIVADPQRAEATLAAGQLPCPHCGGVLRAWAHARTRRIRGLPDPVRPRRALCAANISRRSQVLLPGALLPRRADATEIVGTALGHRHPPEQSTTSPAPRAAPPAEPAFASSTSSTYWMKREITTSTT